jgi:hypothetical protein
VVPPAQIVCGPPADAVGGVLTVVEVAALVLLAVFGSGVAEVTLAVF